ncbi:uncharacterized protein LOC126796412 isoform X2 [Argentina anserina]|uniref:uncharacterized protein LOC126796412 isoform X2 n=1 Tax=Argentina anserina TaxID=57926 RepID=UPI0021764DF6|nr:uncharacterized protein LOC126796412 isoform X2 [Potentilla anserina]
MSHKLGSEVEELGGDGIYCSSWLSYVTYLEDAILRNTRSEISDADFSTAISGAVRHPLGVRRYLPEMSPQSVAAVMILITLFTTTHSINNTITSRSVSSWCEGGRTDNPSCLIGGTDLDSDEFMMYSEISRRILAGNSGTKNVIDPSKTLSCDRSKNPQCHAGQKNSNPPGVDCVKAKYNRICHKYP